MDRLEEQVDTCWKQRAHVNWLQYGDRNTSYFHHACSERRRRNHIGNLRKDDGSWVEEEEEEEKRKSFITNHFINLFRSNTGDVGSSTQQVLDAVVPRVTSDMNEMLTAEFTADEVKCALDSIGDLKAPGPDGMPAVFFKEYWDLIGGKLTEEVLKVLNGQQIPPDGIKQL